MGIVTEGILNMPFELAMSDELLRRQFYDTVRAELSRIRQENDELRAQLGQAASTRQKMNDAMAGLHSQAERAEADNARLRDALKKADRHFVNLYNGIAPQARYDDELTLAGHISGNRHADNDEVVQSIRAALDQKQ